MQPFGLRIHVANTACAVCSAALFLRWLAQDKGVERGADDGLFAALNVDGKAVLKRIEGVCGDGHSVATLVGAGGVKQHGHCQVPCSGRDGSLDASLPSSMGVRYACASRLLPDQSS